MSVEHIEYHQEESNNSGFTERDDIKFKDGWFCGYDECERKMESGEPLTERETTAFLCALFASISYGKYTPESLYRKAHTLTGFDITIKKRVSSEK